MREGRESVVRKKGDALVEDFADFASERARRIGLLEDGEAVAAKLVGKSEIGAVASGKTTGMRGEDCVICA